MKCIVPVVVALSMQVAIAEPVASDLSVSALSRCDGKFFAELGVRRLALEQLAPMSASGAVATFTVPDRRHLTKSRVLFSRPVELQGLKIVGFFDEVAEIPNGMTSYTWGYLVADTVAKTAATLQPLLWDASRLRSDGPVFVRSEVWSHDRPEQGWAKVQTEAGVPKRSKRLAAAP